MSKFKKYLKNAVHEKAPDKWNEIEKAAKENLPSKKKRKGVPKFIYSPAALVVCAVILISAVVFLPRIDSIWNPNFDSTSASGSVGTSVSSTSVFPSENTSTAIGETTDTTAEHTSTIATTVENTSATTTASSHAATTETTEITSTTFADIYEIRYADFGNEYGSFRVKYKYYTTGAKASEITGIEVLSGSEFMLPAYLTLENKKTTMPEEIYIENSTGAPLKKLSFEEGIVRIFAQVSDGAESIYIPTSLVNIDPDRMTSGKSVFYAANLSYIEVSGKSEAYCSINGVLFSADRKTLVRFPTSHSQKDYIIPYGTKKAVRNAFLGVDMQSLTVPDGLSKIYLDSLHIGKLYLPETYVEVVWGYGADVDKIVSMNE